MAERRWRRLRKLFRKIEGRRILNAHQYALLSGVDHAASYINGYAAAAEGRAVTDHRPGHLQGAALHLVWWRRGWQDFASHKAMDPYAFALEKYEAGRRALLEEPALSRPAEGAAE